jgi:branched-subunit amino acid aminotransferase/4-amino-4-deoxychorismate lyase
MAAMLRDSHLGDVTAPETPQLFLKQYPDSVYTTMLVTGGEIIDLELHLGRLSR